MLRWTYLIPRVIILGLITLVIWLSIDPLLTRALVYHTQAVTGAKVQIGQLRSTLGKGKVFLQDVQIADPRDPATNIFQADMAYLDIDVPALLRKQIVITGGRSSDVRFGSPRTDLGLLETADWVDPTDDQLPTADTLSPTEPASPAITADHAPSDTDRAVAAIEQQWLQQLQSQVTGQSDTTLQVSQAAAELAAQWPARLKETQSQLILIDTQVQALRGALQTDNSNPLRQDFRSALANISTLIDKADILRTQLQGLRETSAADQQRLTEVQQTDRLAIDQLVTLQTYDAETISQLLLTRSQAAHVDDIMRWFAWFHDSVPDFDDDLQTQALRGRDVRLVGHTNGGTASSNFLVQELNLEGAGHFAGQYLNFAGKVRDFSSQPARHHRPISFELRAQGRQHLVVKCELDRREGARLDRLEVRCPDLAVEPAPLGTPGSLLLAVGQNLKMQADVQLRSDGDQVSGELVFRHSNVVLHVDQLNALAGGAEMASRLNQELAACDHYETRVAISGQMDRYATKMTSNLGDKIADAMRRAGEEMANSRLVNQHERLDTVAQSHIEGLTTQVDTAIDQLSDQLTSNRNWLTETRDQISTVAKQQWPDIR